MSDEKQEKAVEMQFNYQVDQQVSVNAYFDTEIEGETVRFQITSRYNSTPEKIVKTVNTAIKAFEMLRQDHSRQFIAPPVQEVRVPIDDSGNEQPEVKTFTADKLSVSMHDGKYYYKVVGKPFTQYGVPVWNEVLEAAKLDVSDPNNLPHIAGWRADYIEQMKDGKKRMKVTRLLPSKSF